MLSQMLSYADAALGASTPAEASARFFEAVRPLGATYIQTRLYRRPTKRLTSDAHFAAGGVVLRLAPPTWPGSDAFNYICFECNPVLAAIRESRTLYRFTDFAPRQKREFGTYWDALSEADMGEVLCATSYGRGRSIASLHLGFEDPDVPPGDAQAIQLAGLLLTQRLMDFAVGPDEAPPALTPRERDSLAFVADGKTDWEISTIFGVSQATVRFHVDNAKRKLGAINRAQAVAHAASAGLI